MNRVWIYVNFIDKIRRNYFDPKDYIIAPNVAEATAAVKFSGELGFFRMVLEGNTLKVVQMLKKDG